MKIRDLLTDTIGLACIVLASLVIYLM